MADEQFIYMSLDDFVKWKENTLIHNGEQIPYNTNVVPFVPDKTPEQLAALQTEIETLRTKVATLEESGKKYYRHDISIPLTNGGTLHISFQNSVGTAYTTFGQISSYIKTTTRQVAYMATDGYGSVSLSYISGDMYLVQGAVCGSNGVAIVAVEETFASSYSITDIVNEL